MEVVVIVGAGLDVHKKTVVACCIDGRGNPPAVHQRTFRTFRSDLEQLRQWLVGHGVTHVAMESTGVYWIPVYRVLEGSFELVLGNSRHMKNVPGRKTDASDAQWTADLLRHGLIKKNFVPPQQIRQLRQLTRNRRKYIQTRTSLEHRIRKLLETANIKLDSVASELFGVSGRAMLGALSVGITDPAALAEMARGKLRRKRGDLELAFAGNFSEQDQHLLNTYLSVIESIEQQLSALEPMIAKRVEAYESIIQNLDTIPGIDRTLAVELIAETGVDMHAWTNERSFVAWTGTCPGNRESAGKRRRAPVREGDPYIKAVLTQAAVCAGKTIGTYLSGRYRRLSRRLGPRRAVVAIAREIALASYWIIERGAPYKPPEPKKEPTDRRARKLLAELKKLGVEVTVRNPIAA